MQKKNKLLVTLVVVAVIALVLWIVVPLALNFPVFQVIEQVE